MRYYAYLRRTPEQERYDARLRVGGEDRNNIRAMTGGFINSSEYGPGFGQP